MTLQLIALGGVTVILLGILFVVRTAVTAEEQDTDEHDQKAVRPQG